VDLNGILPPIPTPFLGESIDWRGLSANVARWARAGLRGLVVLGTNGEAPFVSADEAERLIGAVRQELPRDQIVIAGTGQPSTAQSIAATRAASRAGADAALVITPFYYKAQMTAEALVRHYTEVADASPIPILLYNMPPATGVALPIAAVARLAAHPQVVGIKDSSGDVAFVADLVAATPSSFQVIVGVAPNLFASLCVGARGGVVAVANVFPELCVKLHALMRAGRHTDALEVQRVLTPLGRAVTTTYGVAGLKTALDAAGYAGGSLRLPLLPLGAQQALDVRQMVERLQGWASERLSSLDLPSTPAVTTFQPVR
jgi:4-hydroxy-2-oxoglutarate aldolase